MCSVITMGYVWLQKDEDRRRSDDKRSVSEQRKKEEQDRREREVRGAGL